MCRSSVIGSAAARSTASMVTCNSVTTLTLGLASRTTDTNVIMLPRTSLLHLQSYLSVTGKIHPEFLCLLLVLADMQTVKYFNLVGDEEDIRNERFKWSRASTFSYNKNAIGLAVAYASAIRTDDDCFYYFQK